MLVYQRVITRGLIAAHVGYPAKDVFLPSTWLEKIRESNFPKVFPAGSIGLSLLDIVRTWYFEQLPNLLVKNTFYQLTRMLVLFCS